MVKQKDLVNAICARVGIRARKKPNSIYLDKLELTRILSWMEVVSATKTIELNNVTIHPGS